MLIQSDAPPAARESGPCGGRDLDSGWGSDVRSRGDKSAWHCSCNRHVIKVAALPGTHSRATTITDLLTRPSASMPQNAGWDWIPLVWQLSGEPEACATEFLLSLFRSLNNRRAGSLHSVVFQKTPLCTLPHTLLSTAAANSTSLRVSRVYERPSVP